MASYLDLGFNDFMSQKPMDQSFINAENSDAYLEGISGGQITKGGVFEFLDGQWYLNLDTGSFKLPPGSVQTGNIFYGARAYKAIVSNSGKGDYDNIQSAIDYVHREGGGSIFITEGTYQIESNITLYSKIKLYGEGPSKTIIDFKNSKANISLTGGANELNLVNSFSPNANQSVTIADLTVKNSQNNNGAVYISYVMNLLIQNVIFDSNYQGLKTVLCKPCRIEDNVFINNTGTDKSFYLVNGGMVNINNNLFKDNNEGYGLSLEGGGATAQITVSNNLFDNVACGTLIEQGSYYIFSNNHYNYNSEAIQIVVGSQVLISNNLFILLMAVW